LQFDEPPIVTIGKRHQLLVAAGFAHLAILEEDDLVGTRNGRCRYDRA